MSEGLHLWGAENAPPVLLLHCTLAHGGAWKRVARHLSDRFRLIAPDMVAHGQGPPGDRTRDFHDQTTEHAAGFLPEAPTHLVGHSFGATVALRMAIEAPDRVASLTLFEPVLFAAAPDGSEKRANAETLARMEPMIAAGDERDAARLFLSLWGSGEDFDALPKGEAARMAAQMWMIPAQRAALHDDKARLFAEVGAGPLPGSADGRRGVAAGDRADPRHARGRAFRRAAREDRGRGAHGTDHPCRRGCRGAR